MTLFRGSGVAVFTPFTTNKEVNCTIVAELIDWHLVRGTDAIVTCGTTGESPTLSDDEHKELGNLIQLSISVLTETMQPQGFNIGMNLGRVAGAGIEDHLHYHIVPRWNGDTNFMPILGETKVVSEALNKSYDRLKTVIDTITKGLK